MRILQLQAKEVCRQLLWCSCGAAVRAIYCRHDTLCKPGRCSCYGACCGCLLSSSVWLPAADDKLPQHAPQQACVFRPPTWTSSSSAGAIL